MQPAPDRSFKIEEVTSPQTPYLPGMNRWLERVFPEYCPPRFDRLLIKHRHPDGRHQIQLFVGLVNGQVAGLLQMFFLEWQGGLLAEVDLLGVLEAYRGYGLAMALFRHSLHITQAMAEQYELPAIGLTTLIDPKYAPIVQLHRKQGGQFRTDYEYLGGDIIIWYPMQEQWSEVPSPLLGEQFRLFGRLLDC